MFEPSDKVLGLMAQVEAFMDEHVFPRELEHWEWVDDERNRWVYPPWFEDLKAGAKKAGAKKKAARKASATKAAVRSADEITEKVASSISTPESPKIKPAAKSGAWLTRWSNAAN